ncbi:MAG: inverse autotransporter beta domain-containing protein, partial [Alphaproteobacteria bacterium]|nr:inverse autotransporter beta domain-containing protein [Alphaproteobacteria bacterium]
MFLSKVAGQGRQIAGFAENQNSADTQTAKVSGRARPAALLCAAAALTTALVLLGAVAVAEDDPLLPPSDPLGKNNPERVSAEYGVTPGATTRSETDELRRYVRGETASRILGLAARGFQSAGQKYLGERFRVNSSLLWTENNDFAGEFSLIVPLRDTRGRATFLQPGFIAWSGDDLDGVSDDRLDWSVGIVHRARARARSVVGGSLFLDGGRYGHRRAGVGLDYQFVQTRFAGNFYLPLTDAETGFGERREHALRGFDLSLEQGVGERFSASVTGGVWETLGRDAASVGVSKNTFKGDVRYYFNEVVSFRGGYEWSDDYLNTSDGYRLGIDFRLPAGARGRGRGFVADPWAPVRRESRIFVARAVETLPPSHFGGIDPTFLPTVRVKVDNVEVHGPVDRPASGVRKTAAEVTAPDGSPEVTYAINWNAGSARLNADFNNGDVVDGDGVSLLTGDDGNCATVPAGAETFSVTFDLIPPVPTPAPVRDIRVVLTPVADEAGCATAAAAGVPAALLRVEDPRTGTISFSLTLKKTTGVATDFAGYVSVQGWENSAFLPSSQNDRALTEENALVYRVYLSSSDTDATGATPPQWPSDLEGRAVEAVVTFRSDAVPPDRFNDSYRVKTTAGAAAVSASSDEGRYIVNLTETSPFADFELTLGEGVLYRAQDSVVYLRVQGGARGDLIPGRGGGRRGEARVTLGPDPVVRFGDDEIARVVDEGAGRVRVPIEVSYLPAVETTFTVAATGTAIENTDYVYSTASVTFTPSGARTEYLEIDLTDDTTSEAPETIILTLPTVGDFVPATDDGVLTLTIEDNEPKPTLSVEAVSVDEGDSGAATATVTVRMDGASSEDVVGTFSTADIDGSDPLMATAGTDYTAITSQQFTIPANQLTTTVTVTVLGDEIDEVNEQFEARIASASAFAKVGSRRAARVTITDDDGPYELSVSDIGASESGGVARLTVTLSGVSSRDVRGRFSIAAGTAVAGSDYRVPRDTTFTIPAGSRTTTIEIPLVQGGENEDAETFTVRITSSDPRLATVGSSGSATVTVRDSVEVQIALKDSAGDLLSNLDEDAVAGAVTIEVTLSADLLPGAAAVPVVLSLNLPDGVTATPSPSSLSFAAGEGTTAKTATFTLSSVNNSVAEPDRTVTARATPTVTGGRVDVSSDAATATLTLADDDADFVALTVTPSPARVAATGSAVSTLTGVLNRDIRLASAGDTAVFTATTAGVSETLTFTDNNSDGVLSSAELTTTADFDPDRGGVYNFSFNATTYPAGISPRPSAAAATVTATSAISVASASEGVSANEGASAAIVVNISPRLILPSSLTIDYTDTTAVADDDYNDDTTTLTLPANADSATLNVPVINDAILEADETFTVSLEAVADEPYTITANAVGDVTKASSVVTITDDDTLTLSVADITVAEDGGTAELTVTMSGVSSSAVNGTWLTTDGGGATGATAGADYTAVTGGAFTITAGETTATLTVSLTDDNTFEPAETFTVTIATTATRVSLARPTATVTLTEDDLPPVITMDATTLSVSESGGTAEVDFSLDRPASRPVVVGYTLAQGDTSPAQSADLTNGFRGGQVTVSPSAVAGTITIPIASDNDDDTGETFKVTLTSPDAARATVGTPGETVVTINDEIVVLISLKDSAGDALASLDEDAATGAVTIEASLSVALASGAAALPVVLSLDLPDGITATPSPSSLSFAVADGTTAKTATFTLSGVNNSIAEPDRTVTVTAMPTVGGRVDVSSDAATATVTLEDDDADFVALTVTPSPPTVAAAGSVSSTLTGVLNRDIRLASAGGTAVFTDSSGTAATLTFTDTDNSGVLSAGELTTTASFDPDLGGVYNFSFTPTTYPAGISPRPSAAAATVTATSEISVSSATATVTATEGANATVTIDIAPRLAAASSVTVNYTDTTATADNDYNDNTVTLTLPANADSATLNIPLIDDSILESAETFTVTLAAVSGQPYTLGSRTTSTVTITDNDSATLSVDDITVAEDAGTAELTVTLSSPPAEIDVEGTWSTTDVGGATGATAGSDYTAVSGAAFTVTAGEATATLTVSLTDDNTFEPAETFTVTIDATTAQVSEADATATVTLTEDDLPPVLTMDATALAVSETAGTAEVTFSLDKPSSRDVVVGYTLAQGDTNSATAADFGGNFGAQTPVTVSAETTTGTLTIPITTDNDDDTGETFKVILTSPDTTRATVGTPSETVVTISDEIVVLLSLKDSGGDEITSVDEDAATGAVTVEVRLSEGLATGAADLPVVLSLDLPDGVTATTPAVADFTGSTVTRTATFTLSGVNNDIAEPDRAVTVTATPTLDGGRVDVAAGAVTAMLTLADDDADIVALTVTPSPTTIAAAGSVSSTLTGVLNKGVRLASQGGTVVFTDSATAGAATTLTFTDSDSSGVLSSAELTTTASFDPDLGAVYNFSFSPTTYPAGLARPSAATATVTATSEVAVSSSTATVTATEGANATITIDIAPRLRDPSMVTVNYTDGTAAVNEDYTRTTTTLALPANADSATLNVPLTDDGVLESAETFTVTLAAVSGQPYTLGSQTTSTVTITDDDTETLSIENVTVDEDISGNAVSLTVTMSEAAGINVSGTFSTTDGTATAGSDYTAALNTPFTIAAGATTETITVNITDDDLFEETETFTVTIATTQTGVTASGATATATVTITENDAPPEITMNAATLNAAESAAASVAFTLNRASSRATTLNYALAAGVTNPAGADDIGGAFDARTFTVPAGMTSGTLPVTVVNDTLVEANETFTVTLTTGANYTLGAPAATTVTITDDDTATFTVTAAPAAPVINIPFMLTGTLNADIQVASNGSLTFTDSSAAPDLVFTDGDRDGLINGAERTVNVSYTHSTAETLSLSYTLTAEHGLADAKFSGGDLSLTVGPKPVLQFVAGDVTKSVGESAGTVTLGLTLDKAVVVNSSAGVTVTAGTATETSDYTAVTSVAVTTADDTSLSFTVPIVSNNIVEQDETFTVTLAAENSASFTIGSAATATVTITDDDTSALTVTANPTTPTATREFTITGSLGSETVQVPTDGKITFTDSSATDIVFTDGNSNGLIDTASERSATVNYTHNTSGSLVLDYNLSPAHGLTAAKFTGGDLNLTLDPLRLSVPATADVLENVSEGEVSVTVTLSHPAPSGGISGTYTTSDGTATGAGATRDYVPVTNGTFIVPSGQTTAMVTVSIDDDTVSEGGETFDLTIAVASGDADKAEVASGAGTTTVTITDDDSVSARLALKDASSAAVSELLERDAREAVITAEVTLTGPLPPGGPVTVTVAVSLPSGVGAIAAQTVTFNAGEGATAKPVNFTIPAAIVNAVNDDPRTISVTATPTTVPAARGALVSRTPAAATLTVQDDDPILSFSVSELSPNEGDTVTVTVRAAKDVGEDLSVPLSLTLGTAEAEDIVGALTGRAASIPKSMREGEVDIVIADDTSREDAETFTIDLGASLPTGATRGAGVSARTVTIADADTATLSIAAPAPVDEDISGNAVSLTVTLSEAAGVDVSGTFSTTDGTATAGSDYTAALNMPFTISAGQTTETVTVTITDDELFEENEDFTVTIAATTPRVSVTTATATVTINEDDAPPVLTMDAATLNVFEAAGTAALAFSLDRASSRNVVVGYTVAAGDATPVQAADLTNGFETASVTVNAGVRTGTITVPIEIDTTDDDGETFKVTLTSSDVNLATVGTPAETVVTIKDAIGVSLSLSDEDGAVAELSEGVAANRKIMASVSLGSNLAPGSDSVSVAVSVSDAAILAAQTLTFGAGEGATAKVLTFDLPAGLDNSANDDDRTLTFTATPTVPASRATEVSDDPVTADITLLDDDPVVTFDVAPRSALEGSVSEVTLTVTADKPVNSDLELPVTVTTAGRADAADAADIGGGFTTRMITMMKDANTVSETITIVDDNLVEEIETFTVGLDLSASRATLKAATDPALVTINDADTATLAIADVTVAENTDDKATLTVTLTGAAGRDIAGTWMTSDGTATVTGGDYTAVTSGNFTIREGGTTATVEVDITDDQTLEASENFMVVIATAVPRVTVTRATATVTVTDADTATLSVADVTVNEGDAAATLRVSLNDSRPAGINVAGTWSTTDGTAKSAATAPDNDFTAIPAATAFTIPAGDTGVDLTVNLNDDQIFEPAPSESFTATIVATTARVSAATGDPDGEATVTITEDDAPPVLSMDATARNVSETSGTVELAFTLDRASRDPVAVGYTIEGGGTNPATAADINGDFGAQTAVTVPAGMTSGVITVGVVVDAASDSGETINVTLTSADTNLATVDSAKATTVVTINDEIVLELMLTDSGTPLSTLTEDAAASKTVTIEVSLSENLVSDADPLPVVLAVALPTGLTVTAPTVASFAGGEGTTAKTATFVIPAAIDNDIAEPPRTVTVTATPTLSGRVDVSGTAAEATLRVTDDDDGDLRLAVSANPATVVAGSGTSVLTGALSGADVRLASAGDTVVFTDSATSAALTFTDANNNGVLSGGELTTTVNFAPSLADVYDLSFARTTFPAAIARKPAAAAVRVTATSLLSLTAGAATTEGGTATFTVGISPQLNSASMARVTLADGTATANADFGTTAALLTLPANSDDATFTVSLVDDNIVEAAETFKATISAEGSAPPYVISSAASEATATITDGDTSALTISTDAKRVVGQAFTITGTLDTAVQIDDGETLTFTDSATSTTLTFTAGASGVAAAATATATFTPAAAGALNLDYNLDPATQHGIVAAKFTGGVLAPETDHIQMSVPAAVTVAEEVSGGKARVTVTLSETAPSGGVRGTWLTADGTATAGSDYTAVTAGAFTIAAGQTTETLEIDITADAVLENDETFTVTVAVDSRDATKAEVVSGAAAATVTITDNDTTAVGLSLLDASDAAVDELLEADAAGDVITASVSLTHPLPAGVPSLKVDLAVVVPSGVTAVAAREVTFAAGEGGAPKEVDFTIPANIVNAVNDDPREIRVTATPDIPAGLSGDVAATAASGVIAILDDDPVVSFGVNPLRPSEGQTVTVTVAVTKPVSAQLSVPLELSVSGAATAEAADIAGSLTRAATFARGASLVNVTFAVADDALVEGDETFTVNFGSLPAGATTSETAETVTIADTDTATLAVADVTVAEDVSGGEAELTVTMTGATAGVDVTGSFTTQPGTATATLDYDPAGGSFTIAEGDTSGTFAIDITDDDIFEESEAFTVTISAPSLTQVTVPSAGAEATV